VKNAAQLAGAFLLGVVCTIGVYEVVRFITNTRDALQAASALATDDPSGEAAVVAKRLSQAPKNRVDVDDAMRERLERKARKQAEGRTGRTDLSAKERRERRRKRRERALERRRQWWKSLSPEEQEAVRQKNAKRTTRPIAPMAGNRLRGVAGRGADDEADWDEAPVDDERSLRDTGR
jgi:hypothetical protein